MKEQMNLFGGISEDLSQGTPELEHAYRMMIGLQERMSRLSETVQRLRKEVWSLRDECHSLQIRHVENWKIRRELDRLRAEIET